MLYILVVVWMIVIFNLSNMSRDNSDKTSRELLYKIVSVTNSNKSDSDKEIIVDKYNIFIRKCAHVTEYLILSILIYLALIYTDIDMNKSIIFSIIISIIYACSDEIHQLFVSGRGGQIRDVFIDSIGVLISMMIIKIRAKIKNK